MSKSCHYHLLVNNGVCQVKYCADCNNVHLMLGAMTLHLTGQQFEQLAHGLRKAAAQKQNIDQPQDTGTDNPICVIPFPGLSGE